MKRNLTLLTLSLLISNAAALAVETKTSSSKSNTSTSKSLAAPKLIAQRKKGLTVPPPPRETLPGNRTMYVPTANPTPSLQSVETVTPDSTLVSVGEGGPYTSKDEKVQRFVDYVELKKGLESAALTLTIHNNGFKWFRLLIANQVVATEKSQKKDGTVKLDVTGVIQPGSNQVVVQAGGARGASVDWKVTTVASAKLERVDPDEALIGETVNVKGLNFALNPAANEVKFNSSTGKVIQAKATELKVQIPANAEPGDNTITAKVNGVKTNSIKIKIRGIPQVTGSNMTGVPPGQTISIYGKNFSKNLGENRVFFDETSAEIVSGTTSELVVVVPFTQYREGHYPSLVKVQVGKVMSKTSAPVQVGPQMFNEPNGTATGKDIPEFVAQ